MSDPTITQLTAVSALDDDDLMVVIEDGVAKKVSIEQLRAKILELPLDLAGFGSGDARNDEFDSGPTIDPKWTFLGTAVDLEDVDDTLAGHLHMRRNDTGSGLSVYYQDVPTAPFSIFCKITSTTGTGNYMRGGGIVLLPAAPTTASAGVYVGHHFNGAYLAYAIKYNAISGSFGSNIGGFTMEAGRPVWVRVDVLSGGTTVDIYLSINGTNWVAAAGAYACGFTVGTAGVAFAPEGSSTDVETMWDFYRVDG